MRSKKQNVYIAARKRGLEELTITRILGTVDAPPTHKEQPRYHMSPYIGPDGNTYYTRVPWDLRPRELTDEQYEKAMTLICG